MENQNHIKPKGPGKVGSKKGCGGGWAVDRKLAEGPCTNANPVTGSKNQKFEFRSRLQLRRIDVHINQLCNRHPPPLYTHTHKNTQTGGRRYIVGPMGAWQSVVSQSNAVLLLLHLPLIPVVALSFVNQVEMPHRKKKQSTGFGESGNIGREKWVWESEPHR